MSTKTLSILIVLVVIFVIGGIIVRLRGGTEPAMNNVPSVPVVSVPGTPAAEQAPLVQKSALTEQEKRAMISLERVAAFTEPEKVKYRIVFETAYPVSTASIALRYDVKKMKLESVGSGDGLFLSALPTDTSPWGSFVSRTQAGGTGLKGKGTFAEVVFASRPEDAKVSLDLSESGVFLNDGWGTKAILETSN